MEELKTSVPEGVSGDWSIERFSVKRRGVERQVLQFMVQGGQSRIVTEGVYTRLMRNRTLVMSDTPAEIQDFREAISHAEGHCLIGGLGLGIVTTAILLKPEVSKVTVIEKSSDVINLVGGYLKEKFGDRLEIIEGDILKWQGFRGKRFGMAWFDIWDNICEDNLSEMSLLNRRYGQKSNWVGCWQQEGCRFQRVAEQRYNRWR